MPHRKRFVLKQIFKDSFCKCNNKISFLLVYTLYLSMYCNLDTSFAPSTIISASIEARLLFEKAIFQKILYQDVIRPPRSAYSKIYFVNSLSKLSQSLIYYYKSVVLTTLGYRLRNSWYKGDRAASET